MGNYGPGVSPELNLVEIYFDSREVSLQHITFSNWEMMKMRQGEEE